MNREDDAQAAVLRLIDCGADDLTNNDGFIAIKSHLEAMDIFNQWNKLQQTQQTFEPDQVIDSSFSFVKVNHYYYNCY